MRVTVPSAVMKNSYEPFPKGRYDGTISGAQIRDPNNDGSWVLIKLSLDSVTPAEGTADPGRDRFSGDITLRNTSRDGETQDVRQLGEINGSTQFSVKTGARLLAGLAASLGVGEAADDGSVTVDFEAVADALVDGQFESQRIGFEVGHYKDRDQFEAFAPAS